MDFKNRHPLNAIDGYENLSFLEALIPFVDYSLKLPLALFLKYSETRLIIKCFRSNQNLIRLGLHHPCNDPSEMISAFCGISPDLLKIFFSMMDKDNNSMFNDFFKPSSNTESASHTDDTTFGFSPENISKAMHMFQSLQSDFEKDKHSAFYNSNESSTNESDDFEHNIQQLLAEYDSTQNNATTDTTDHDNHINLETDFFCNQHY